MRAAAAGVKGWRQYAGLMLLLPLVLASLALWLEGEYKRSDAARGAVNASFERRFQIAELLSTMKDAETGQRGYIITGDPDFLGPYTPARAEVERRVAGLRRLLAGSDRQLERLTRLKSSIDDKFTEMAEVIRVRDAGGIAAAQARVSRGIGRAHMDHARRIVAVMDREERKALVRDLGQERHRSVLTQRLLWGLVILLALITLGGTILAARARAVRERLESRARDSAARMGAIFGSTIDAIFTLNPSGTIETFNPAAERMFGYSGRELDRRDISILFDLAPGTGSFAERVGLVDGVLRNPMVGERPGRRKDGTTIPVDIALGTMALPDGMHVVAAVRDISERKQVERLKDEFVSTVSHELRTPLTSVVGSLGLLRGGTAGALPDAAQRLVEIAENNARRLIRLINDILDIDKMGSGKMRFENVLLDLRDVARQAIEVSSGSARTKEISLRFDPPEAALMVRGDLDRLVQVTANLLSNAIRFTPDGGTVTLALTSGAGRTRLTIVDQGPGVPAEFRDQIFSRFAQATGNAAPNAGGSGLGLAISREIIRHHDGRIWFEDAPGGGALFAFEVPMSSRVPLSSGAGDRLLVCEDDADAAETIRSMVMALNFEVDVVGTGEEALEYARSGRYMAVLLDVHLPGAAGLDVVRTLRQSPETRELPVIIISGTSRRDMAQDDGSCPFAAADIIDWIDKPVDHHRLVSAIKIALERTDGGRATLLHVDDDEDLREVTAAALAGQGRVVGANNLASARAVLLHQSPDIVILDIGLPDGSGLDLLPELMDERGIAIPTIIYSAQDVAIDQNWGVQAVLVKSRRSLPNLAGTIHRILQQRSGEGVSDG